MFSCHQVLWVTPELLPFAAAHSWDSFTTISSFLGGTDRSGPVGEAGQEVILRNTGLSDFIMYF